MTPAGRRGPGDSFLKHPASASSLPAAWGPVCPESRVRRGSGPGEPDGAPGRQPQACLANLGASARRSAGAFRTPPAGVCHRAERAGTRLEGETRADLELLLSERSALALSIIQTVVLGG